MRPPSPPVVTVPQYAPSHLTLYLAAVTSMPTYRDWVLLCLAPYASGLQHGSCAATAAAPCTALPPSTPDANVQVGAYTPISLGPAQQQAQAGGAAGSAAFGECTVQQHERATHELQPNHRHRPASPRTNTRIVHHSPPQLVTNNKYNTNANNHNNSTVMLVIIIGCSLQRACLN